MNSYKDKLLDAIRYAVTEALKECGIDGFKKTSLFMPNHGKEKEN